MDDFLNSLRRAGKSELTVKQYKNTLMRFTGWLSDDPHPTPRTPHESRRIGSETYTQKLNISNSINTHRGSTDGRGHYTPGEISPEISERYLNSTEVPLQTLRGVTELDVADFKRWAIHHYQPGTVKVMLTQLKVFYRWLIGSGQVPDNPVKTVKTITVVKQAPKWLSRKEQNQLIRAVRKQGNLRELTLVTLMLHTGLRVQEVADLRVEDVQIGERKGKVTVRNGKHSRRREVPLNIDCREVIKKYLQDNPGLDYIFSNKTGSKITTRSLQFIIEKYRKLTGIEHLNAHSLRHCFCHELVCRKIPLDVVARLAVHVKQDGSPNIQQTLVYTQPGEDDLQRAVEELSWR